MALYRRKPEPNWRLMKRLERSLQRKFRADGVGRVEFVIAFSEPFTFWLWLGTGMESKLAISWLVMILGSNRGAGTASNRSGGCQQSIPLPRRNTANCLTVLRRRVRVQSAAGGDSPPGASRG